ncbi:hypothetical protein [Shinella sp. JR1-6]|uniref:hypothetical protein n=1 Tax=Shinella sp. JR1-6 TaxID=2527671 RepID=UPI00102D3907|nr:hypothetical protein [Shinella sp. JR1-6]TAA54571.1 hypothetical protein EXZ48_26455 [Shinella sp. JR1-6]
MSRTGRPRGSFWTKERDEELLRVSQELKGQALANHFGLTSSYCRYRLRQLRNHIPSARPALLKPEPAPVDHSVEGRVRAAADYRRGFSVPPEKQAEYIELLKTGIPVAEARRRLAL